MSTPISKVGLAISNVNSIIKNLGVVHQLNSLSKLEITVRLLESTLLDLKGIESKHCWSCDRDVAAEEIVEENLGSDNVLRLVCKTCVESAKDVDPHIGCFSYPNCEDAPNGCCVNDADCEPYGHRG